MLNGMVKKSRVGMIGMVVSWCNWKARNDITFNGGIRYADDIVFKMIICNIYEWCKWSHDFLK